jgi:hypothetical protein
MSVREARKTYADGKCPFCANNVVEKKGLDANPFTQLDTAWQLFESLRDLVAVEFIVPAEPECAVAPRE